MTNFSKTKSRIHDDLFYEMQELLEDDFEDLVNDYMEDSLLLIDELQDAFADNDNEFGLEAAHKIKGASANLGILKLSQLCGLMQQQCHNKKIHESSDLIKQVEDEVISSNKEIKSRLN